MTRRNQPIRVLLGGLFCWLATFITIAAGAAADSWKLDRLTLSTGKTIEGMIAHDDGDGDLEFVEVRRSPGHPMNLVVLPIERGEIASIDALSESERSELRARLEKFIHRATIEGRRMDDLAVTRVHRDGNDYWQYQGAWFLLESTADEATTRRAIVRIEQVFTAFRQILAPRRSPQRRLKMLLFGSTAQYADFLRGLGLEIANPAFFAADFNLVAAGSEINRFTEQLALTRDQHAAEKARLETELAKLPDRLEQLSEQLQKNGVPIGERRPILAAEQREWQALRQTQLKRIADADRRNAARFDDVAGQMFARLYHEAFHAYLDNYVYPHHQFDVPRWLNEGLALTFEGGQLEADALRIDAPNRRILKRLQADLRGQKPLPLAELLNADADVFLPAHRGGAGHAARLYEYSWGLAYYLTFEQSLLDTPAFAEFIAPEAGEENAIKRFEKLTGMRLDTFERKWRAAMSSM